MISIYVYNEHGHMSMVDLPRLEEILKHAPDAMYWIDLENPTTEEEELVLRRTMEFHDLAILDCRRERIEPNRGDHLPKVEDYGGYLFSIVNPIDMGKTNGAPIPEIITRQLNVFLGENFIVTHHYEKSEAVADVTSSCSRNALLLERGPDFIYHLILDAMVDRLNPILDRYDSVIEELEEDIFQRTNRTTLPRILAMKRQVFKLRRIAIYQREMVYRLSRGEFSLITPEEIAYYRNVYDHLVRASELAESYRDILTGMLDAYLSMASNRMNEIMKVLAVISTFFLPLTFIAGVYGMNFDPDTSPYNMPELRWFFGYPFAWGLMILVAGFMFFYFKRKKWL